MRFSVGLYAVITFLMLGTAIAVGLTGH